MTVFLSSTCYDLDDLRAVLEKWLRDAGYEPLLSNRANFPTNPAVHRHDVCVQEAAKADLLIAVIDRRAGAPYYKDPSISVTRAEVQAALDAGKPVFVFVRSAVMGERLTWKSNPGIKPAHVDRVDVFEFVSALQEHKAGVWMDEFRNVVEVQEKLSVLSQTAGGLLGPAAKPARTHEGVRLESLSVPAQRLIQRVLKPEDLLGGVVREAGLQQCIKFLRGGHLGVVLHWEIDSWAGDEFLHAVPVRPADDDGSSWHLMLQPTPVAREVSAELQGTLSQ